MTTALGTHSVRVEEWLPEAGILDVVRGAFDPAAVASGGSGSQPTKDPATARLHAAQLPRGAHGR